MARFPAHMTVFVNSDTREYFLSTDHIQGYRSGLPLPEEWVPISFVIPTPERPHFVVPRPSLPDGLITNRAQYLMIFHGDQTEIPNPDPRYQAVWPE